MAGNGWSAMVGLNVRDVARSSNRLDSGNFLEPTAELLVQFGGRPAKENTVRETAEWMRDDVKEITHKRCIAFWKISRRSVGAWRSHRERAGIKLAKRLSLKRH